MFCPACKDTTLSMTERQGVEIDFCPKCRGVWLDRGELDKIIEKSAVNQDSAAKATPSPSQYDSSYHHSKPYKKRKSFLEELFD